MTRAQANEAARRTHQPVRRYNPGPSGWGFSSYDSAVGCWREPIDTHCYSWARLKRKRAVELTSFDLREVAE